MHRKKINYILADYDNCFAKNEVLNTNRFQDYYQKMVSINQTCLQKKVEQIQLENYDEIIVGNGSNRQCKHVDEFNGTFRENGSIALFLPSLQKYFADTLQKEVTFDPFILADVYGQNRKPGDNYKMILQHNQDANLNLEHDHTMFDKNKSPLIYAYAHRVASLHKDCDIVLDFIDDQSDLLAEIYKGIAANPRFLPHNVILRLFKYCHTNREGLSEYEKPIQGTGKIDKCYDWSLRLMSAKSSIPYSSENKEHVKIRKIKSAKELENYHNQNHYNTNWEMNFPSDDNCTIQQFLKLRNSVSMSRKLKPNPDFLSSDYYTTADELINQGLILDNPIKIKDFNVDSSEEESDSIISSESDEELEVIPIAKAELTTTDKVTPISMFKDNETKNENKPADESVSKAEVAADTKVIEEVENAALSKRVGM